MEITQVTVRRIFRDSGRLRAIVSVTLDNELAVHDIRVIQGDKRLFAAMPSRKDLDGIFHDIVHPIGTVFRSRLEEAVLAEYNVLMESREDVLDPYVNDSVGVEPEDPDPYGA